jgi:acetyl-CoA carboxylase carboxyl transferase subunit alpha
MSLPRIDATEPHEAASFTKHLVSQQHFGSPMILVVLNRRNSGEIFGGWFAHKVLAFEQARFLMTIMDQGNHCHVQVGTKILLNCGIIDRVVPELLGGVHHSYSAISKQLRSALTAMLCELSQLSPEDLRDRRREKIERVSAFSSQERGWGD